jgi:elongation factor G
MAFRTAGQIAMREALVQLGFTILEPLMKLEVNVPETYVGPVMGDLMSRRVLIEDQGVAPGNFKTIRGKVPIAEMFQYSTTLRSMTQGRGTFSMEPAHYQAVPRSLQDTIVKDIKEKRLAQQKAK